MIRIQNRTDTVKSQLSIDGADNLVQSATLASNTFRRLVSQTDLEKVERERDDVTEMLCDLCQLLEDTEPRYLHNPDLKKWWETHKELDRLKLEKYKINKEAALENATRARTQQKKYMKYLLDEFLDKEDKDFFNKKISVCQLEIDQAVRDFPELTSEFS